MRCLLFLIVLLVSVVGQAATTISFEPETVSLGESAQLIIESDRPLNKELDLSALVGNFAVAGQQQGVKSVSINGRRHTKYQLSFNVFPRKDGKLSTGDIIINGKPVKGAVLTVEPASENSRLPITFTAEASQNTVYQDETFLYKIKLIYGVALMDAKIMPPDLKEARIAQLNIDKSYQTYANDKPVHVFERTFAITPEKNGYLTIPPIEVYGLVSDMGNNEVDLFSQGMLFNGLLGAQKEVRLETNPVQITVLDKPTDWKGWWLPATDVKISAEDSFPEKISVGDSLTRVIKLTALGVQGEQLPTISQAAGKAFKVYPSPEQRDTIQTPVGDIQGVSETSVILVPTKAGEIIIPEIRVKWFNTRTRKTEVAVLPQKTIMVLPSEAAIETETKQPPQKKIKKEHKLPSLKAKENTIKEEKAESKIGIHWAILGAVLTLCLGVGLGFILFRRHKHHSYLIVDKEDKKKKKKKKPLPDLYPF